jgi:hypothetical protein
MQLLSWLRQQMGGQLQTRSSRKQHVARRCRPRLELLEDRCVPSTLRVNHDFNIHVAADTTTAHGTLAWAVANAQNGDTILLTGDVVQHGITLTHGELILTQQNLTIESEANPVTISGGNVSRVFEVASGAQVTLANVIISGGTSFANNPATGAADSEGGGIVVDPGATLIIIGSMLSGNSAVYGTNGDGGAITNFGTLTIAGSTVCANTVGPYGSGGGITNYGTLTVSGSSVSGNFGGGDGGGIKNVGTLTVTGSMVAGNTVGPYGSGGGIANYRTLTVISSAVSGNTVGPYGSGGGIINWLNATLTVSGSSVSDNSAYNGGGIFNFGTLTVCSSTLSGNSAGLDGGGVFNSGTLYVINGSSVTGNNAPAGADLYNLGMFFISNDSTVGVLGP